MRKLMLAILVLSAAGAMTAVSARHARVHYAPVYEGPRAYAWCITGRETGVPGDCSYQTYAQCAATASGRQAYCDVNPVVAFWRVQHGLPAYPDQRFE
jgi:Protein of unknown function (DUF3551)